MDERTSAAAVHMTTGPVYWTLALIILVFIACLSLRAWGEPSVTLTGSGGAPAPVAARAQQITSH